MSTTDSRAPEVATATSARPVRWPAVPRRSRGRRRRDASTCSASSARSSCFGAVHRPLVLHVLRPATCSTSPRFLVPAAARGRRRERSSTEIRAEHAQGPGWTRQVAARRPAHRDRARAWAWPIADEPGPLARAVAVPLRRRPADDPDPGPRPADRLDLRLRTSRPRVIVCVMIALFPIITNTLFGLLSAERGQHDLFTLHGAASAHPAAQAAAPGGDAGDLHRVPDRRRPVGDRRGRRRPLLHARATRASAILHRRYRLAHRLPGDVRRA